MRSMTGGGATTSGTDTRGPRELHPTIEIFDLAAEIVALRADPAWGNHGRAAKTLAKSPTYRLVLSLLRAGAEVGEDDAWGPLTLHVLEGVVTAGRGTDSRPVPTGAVAWYAAGRGWRARAETDTAVLLGISWPEELAGDADLQAGEPYRPVARTAEGAAPA